MAASSGRGGYTMSRGIIQSLTKERGFGFIQCGDNSRQVFFHHTKLEDMNFKALKEGQTVRFKVALTPKGLEAIHVKPVN
jgi:cold shock CspA family protein